MLGQNKNAIQKNNNATSKNKPESAGERRKIKKIQTMGKAIQAEQDIPKQRKKLSANK